MLSAQGQADKRPPYVLQETDIAAYLRDMEAKNLRQATLDNYRRSLKGFYSWLPEGKQIQRERINEYQHYLVEHYSPGTVNMKMTPVNGLLDFLDLREYQVVEKVPRDMAAVKPELARGEYLRMLSAAKQMEDERLYLLIKLFATTGIAVQELEKVTVEAVQEGSAVTYPNRNREVIRFPECLQRELLAFAKENGIHSGPLFQTGNGSPLHRTSISNMIPRIAKYARLDANKCTPRCLQKLYVETWRSLKSNVAVMLQMTYDRMLEQEQVTYGWEDVQQRV